MSETLPNQHLEQKPWDNKLELHKNAAQLNSAEITAILGSQLLQNRVESDEMYDADTITDSQYEDNNRKIDGALGELAGLQVLGEGSQADFNQHLQLLALSLKQEQEKLPFGYAEFFELADRRASVKYLIDQFDVEIKMPQEELEKDTKPSERREAIKNWTNQTIEAHNNRADGDKTESIADSPEMRAAQERINARLAEQAKQPQPTETVDDARQKVAEAFGDTGEKERQALIDEVAQAAKGATLIYTDIPKELMTKSPSGELYHPIDGFNGFGDGLEPESNRRHERLKNRDSVEAVTIMKTDEGVRVSYQFDTNGLQYSLDACDGKVPFYKTEGGRAGNVLYVEAILPTELASKFEQEISRNPTVAREFAKTLASNNGVSEEIWSKAVRPPYDELPANWQIAVTKS